MQILLAILLVMSQINTDIARAQAWIISQQNANGGWSDGLSERSGPGITVDVLIGLIAAERDFASPADYLHDFTNQNATLLRPALAAKLAIAAVVLGEDARDFAGVDLVEVMLDTDSDQFGDSIFEHCLIMIAAYHAVVDLPASAITFVDDQQDTSGGWGFASDVTPDSNTTAICIQAQIAGGRTNLDAALDFLRAIQNDDAGWTFQKPSDFGTESDAYSTAVVIMALNAAEQNLADWNHPEERLREFQTAEGAFANPDDILPLLATSAALPALTGRSLLDVANSP